MHFNEEFIKKVLPEAKISAVLPQYSSFSIDSRTIEKNDFFIALSGAHHDGHEFIQEAINRGAVGIVIEQKKRNCIAKLDVHMMKKICIIEVINTHQALMALAKQWRALFVGEVVGLTGSVGKTSTKEIIGNVLATAGIQYLISRANQNTLYGLALNILRLRPEYKIAVFEMGINKRGEMAQLADIVRPTVACITNIGHCHMEGLGSINDIAVEKRDIFKYFKEDSIGIINGDSLLLANVAYAHPVIKFGAKSTNQIQVRKVTISSRKSSFILKIYRKKYYVELKEGHIGAVFNALAGASIGYYLGIADELIVKGISTPIAIQGRFEERMLKSGQGIIINDCYNANPESMKAALLAFEQMETDAQKIAVLGDMLELGVNSPFWHRQLGRFLRKVPSLRKVVLVGNLVKWTQKTVPINVEVVHVPSWREAADILKTKIDTDSIVLVKGSHGVLLNNLVEQLS